MRLYLTLLLLLLVFCSIPGVLAVDKTSLAHWNTAVTQADSGAKPLVVVTLGDSNTELPTYALTLRTMLQGCYGARGLGYYTFGKRMAELPGAPKITLAGKWTLYDFADDPLTVKPPEKPWLAMDGLWVSTDDADASLTATHAFPFAMRLHYQVGPGLGSFELLVDNKSAGKIDCAAAANGYALKAFSGTSFQITHITGKVVLFGVDSERTAAAGGVVVHQLGNGWGMAHQFAAIEEEAYRQFFTAVKPDLITVLLGTNDMCNGWDAAGYHAQMRILLGKLRRTAPDASVLVMSCPSCEFDRKHQSREFEQAARQSAKEFGCAYWNLHDFVGDRWKNWDQLGMMEYTLHYTPASGQLVSLELLKQLGFNLYDQRHYSVLKTAPEK